MAHRKQLMFVSSFQFQILKYIVLGQFQQRGYKGLFLVKKEACSGEKVESRNMSAQAFLYLRPWVVQPLPFPSSPLTSRESRPSQAWSPSSTHKEA